MKKQNGVVALFAAFVLIFGIVSCNTNVDTPEEPVYYTVTFDSDGGSSVEPQNIESGKTATKPADPTKTGYDFGGWYNGTSAFDFTKPVTEKITLKAKWTVHTFTITYNLDGGTNTSENPATYTIEDEITLKDAEKTGSTFSGWFNENTKVTKIAKGTTGDLTLTAKWDLATYDVTLNVNGGTISEGKNVTTYTYGTAVTLPTTSEIKRTGYKFDGWFTSNDNGTTFTGDAITEITATDTGNKTFYAKWTAKTYTVTLNVNGGTISEGKNVTTYTYGTAVTLPTANDITRSGYKFCGWFVSNDNGTTLTGDAVTEITATDTGNKVFYAKWLEIYTITYNDVESGLTNPNPTTYTIEDEITLVEIERNGYDFGWYTAPNGSGTRVMTIPKGSTGAKNLWAHWSIKTYWIDLIYRLANGSYMTNCISYTYGTGTTLPTTIEGYDFNGWFTNSNFTGTPVTEISATDSGDKKFWANTTPKMYTITLHIDGGTIADGKNVTSYSYGTGATLPTGADIMKDGHDFGGWFTDAECSGSMVAQISITDTGNKEFWAKWMEKRNEVSGKTGKYGAPYRVGDIVFSDGSAVPYEDLTDTQKQNAVAVIFYVGTDCNNEGNTNTRALGVGLQNSQGEAKKQYNWQSETAEGTTKIIQSMACIPNETGIVGSTATFTGTLDGSKNWTELCKAVSDEEISGNYPMWEWINAYADNNQITGDYSSGWYIPSIAELCMIYRVRAIANAGIEKAGGTKLADTLYWSSSTDKSFASKVYHLYLNTGNLGYTHTEYGGNYSVCAIREF